MSQSCQKNTDNMKAINIWIFKENNLDIIRLLAALQVAILHSAEFMMDETGGYFFHFLRLFPGVPIFFFISGFLISKSFENAPNTWQYAKNRILRIYPALVVCVFINLIMVWSTGYFNIVQIGISDVTMLFLAKASFLQFYNPEFMRNFGDGVLNGSLWTICVELQFYLVIPILYWIFSYRKKMNNIALAVLILIFLMANRLLYIWEDGNSNLVIWKLYRVSFFPWVFMFLAGIFFQSNFKKFFALMHKVPAFIVFLLYLLIHAIWTDIELGNRIGPIQFFLLIVVIFRFAYFLPNLGKKFFKGNDISYGIYIWHMPIVNQLIYLQYHGDQFNVFISVFLSVMLAAFSWIFIERPALSLKSTTLKN